VQGLALGVGARSAAGHTLGGGMQEVVIAHPSQFLAADEDWASNRPSDEVLKTLVLADAYACAINGVEIVIDDSCDRATPIFIIGLGAIGFSVMDYLHQLGFRRLVVLAKHAGQLELAREYGYSARPLAGRDYLQAAISGAGRLEEMGHAPWLRGGYPLVFDCVGSRQSMTDACLLTAEGGHLVELGLPDAAVFDWYLPGRKQIHLHFPFWATRRQFLKGMRHLQNISARCQGLVNCEHSLQEGKGCLRAFFGGRGRTQIKNALRILPFESARQT
jgi:threonine dehydrogenase-like Zn-dependent dehydrogenase